MSPSLLDAAIAPLVPAFAAFHDLARHLLLGEASASDHATVEPAIQARGTEAMRRLLQGWSDERSVAAERHEVTGAGAALRT